MGRPPGPACDSQKGYTLALSVGLSVGSDPPDHRGFSGVYRTRDNGIAGEIMTEQARGTFEVTMTPQPAAEGDPLGRLTIDKHFHGDIVGTSVGQMLAVRTAIEDSAGYVALERVTGTLHGRDGTFALQHSGLMARGVQELSITVVPDSGTGTLEGLSGSLALEIVDGQHRYVLTYALPDTQ